MLYLDQLFLLRAFKCKWQTCSVDVVLLNKFCFLSKCFCGCLTKYFFSLNGFVFFSFMTFRHENKTKQQFRIILPFYVVSLVTVADKDGFSFGND